LVPDIQNYRPVPDPQNWFQILRPTDLVPQTFRPTELVPQTFRPTELVPQTIKWFHIHRNGSGPQKWFQTFILTELQNHTMVPDIPPTKLVSD
jgi:hypothetical protein